MKGKSVKKILLIALLIMAVALFIVGGIKIWDSFVKFDRTIIYEKDNQFDELLHAEDSNLKTILKTYVSEVKGIVDSHSFSRAQDIWINREDLTPMMEQLDTSNINDNPIYAGIVVYRNGKIVPELSTEDSLKFITKSDSNNIRFCTNRDDRIFADYEYKAKDHIVYHFLISLELLLSEVDCEEQGPDDISFILDSKAKVLVYKEGEFIEAIDNKTALDENHAKCRDYIVKCQKTDYSGVQSIDMNEGTKYAYAARMKVLCSKDTSNGVFAIGKLSNYDAILRPSRRAANSIFFYEVLAEIGAALIFIVLVAMNKTSRNAMNKLQKRTETLEEINRRMQELSHHQRLETIGTMTASIAHDFNNLLTPIMGYSMMTMEMLDDDDIELQENMMEVYNASIKAKEIVSRLAELSKKSDETLFVNIKPDELIRESLKVALPTKPESVEVKVSLNCDGHYINGDRTQLSQLILNITLNAYDAMEEQGGTYKVSTKCEDGVITMVFEDNGPGMDAKTVAKIFDPFFTTKASGKGTGLGLAIVAQIVESHNGKIYVDSEPGRGTAIRAVFQEA